MHVSGPRALHCKKIVVADKPRDAFVPMQCNGVTDFLKTRPLHIMCYHVKFGIVLRQRVYAQIEGNPQIVKRSSPAHLGCGRG